MSNSKTIVFTGGHHNSALVVALALKKEGYSIAWFGHKFTQKGSKAISAEFQEVTKNDIPFYELKTGKFYHKSNPLEYLKIALGFIQSLIYLRQVKPKLIFSFGGYLSVPVVIVGYLLGIPSITHEQTVTAGWANKAISPFVKKILLTHQSSLENYPKEKSLVTGLPLRPQLLEPLPTKPEKLIYITCGKQGSHIINKSVFPLIPELVKEYKIIHQTGVSTLNADQERARRLKATLPKSLRSRYTYQPYFFSDQATRFLKQSSLVISRAGAHTTYELLVLQRKSVLIPIPWVSHNEQQQNARLLEKSNLSVVLSEDELTPQSLSLAINKALTLKPKLIHKPILNATQRILDQVHLYLA